MASFSRSNSRASVARPQNRALSRAALLWRVIAAAGTLCAASPTPVFAGPDPCTGVGVVTCSGNQSAGVENPPPGTTVLNVNSLTSDIAPAAASGQPGILFFGPGNITLNSATGAFRIITSGDFVDGIVAVSDGAVNVNTSGGIFINGLSANGINVLSFAGGTVNITSSSDISLAQGGDGILATSDGIVAVTASGAISVVGSGSGIDATAGDHVTVSSSGPISVTGDGDAIDAFDLGGPAGNGGTDVVSSGAITLAGSSAIGINANSADTDEVSVKSSSDISLVNGGGGILAVGLGAVTVSSSGAISVAGSSGTGIAAASGGAGTASVTSTGGISIKGDGAAIVAFSLGGAAAVASSGNISVGGSGFGISAFGEAGATVNSSGSLSLAGDGSAINASSTNGSASVMSSGGISIGGDGVAIAAFSMAAAANVASKGNISIDGSGTGIAAQGNVAQVDSSSVISIAKGGPGIAASGANGATVNSSGAISLGGDGDAIDASSTAGAAIVASSGNIRIDGTGVGIKAQGNSVQVSSSGSIAVANGGTGIEATGLNGAAVTSTGSISVGGGGDAIDAFSPDGPAKVSSSGPITIAGAGNGILASGNMVEVDSSSNITVANGGAAITATGANGVTVNSSGAISVAGRQFVTGISAVSTNDVAVNSAGNMSVSGNSATGIDVLSSHGTASVRSTGAILLSGSGAGIDVHSFGGPVGVRSSSDIVVGSGIAISAESDADVVKVGSKGNIAVSGAGSIGIAALSETLSLRGGDVRVVSSGDITTAGLNSTAILAQATGGDIAVRVTRGTITGGSGTGAGIALDGGSNNTLTNFGTITTSAGLGGTAILGMPTFSIAGSPVTGNNVVRNGGTITGNVDLGPGRNAFDNLPGGAFNSGAAVALGAGNTLTNNGNLSPGGSGVIQTTALTGNLVQGGAGKISVDLNPATSQADRINATGSANLGGQIVLDLANATPTTGATTVTLVHADGGVTDSGLALGALPAVAAYQLEFLDANDLVLQGGLNFAPGGLNGNQTAIGQNINAIQLAGSSSSFLPVVQAILTIPDVPTLAQAYDQLSPETYADNEIGDFYSGLRFANSLMSCKVADGRYAFIKEGQCVWAQIGGKFLNLDATSGSLGFRESALTMAGGAEMMLRPDWFASFALGYDNGNTGTGNTLAESRMNRAHFGAAIKYNPGPYLFAAAVYGGYGWYTTDRNINFDDFSATASSDSRISRVGGLFRAAYLVDRTSWYLKPLVDLNVMRINLNGFSEGGAGGADLIVSGSGSTVFSASPAVEIGMQRSLQNGGLLRPFAQLGVSAFSNTDFGVNAAFSGAPAGTPSFRVMTGIDALTADVAAGADLFVPDSRWVLKLAYAGHYGARVRDQGFRLKASIRF